MTTPDERTRSLLWAGGLLIEIAKDERLPIDLRRRAIVIARHFPTIEDVSYLATLRDPTRLGPELESPLETPGWADGCQHGPLKQSTRLQWPE